VYVEEVSGGPRPIEAVGTSTAGFVGAAPSSRARVHEAVAITNWSQFLKIYVEEDSPSTSLAQAVYGFFLNGGRRCYVVNTGEGGELTGTRGHRAGLDVLEEVNEVAIVAAPGHADPASYDAVLSHCEKLKDRVAVLDAPEQVRDLDPLTVVGTLAAGGEAGAGLRPRVSEGGYGACYFPWISVRDPLSGRGVIQVPPSGHVAGIFARSDAGRGVHKAPANEIVRGALDVAWRVTDEEQGALNQAGINCIRYFHRDGIRVWGARTLADAASEWRYLNVRRLFNMIEESIVMSTRWVVFEPNDASLWKTIRRDIGAFLTRLWRDGALAGRTPEEAFFVQCDEETNPPEVIDAGQVVTVIGIAPVKPAEFIVLRIGQHAGGAEIRAEGGGSRG
jgi:phage tail sheath protein FI